MGIKGWFTVFGDSSVEIKEKNFKDKYIGVDVSYDIFRASLGMKDVKSLTDKNGISTVLLNVLLFNIVRYKKLGIKGLLYIFDNPNPNPLKILETTKRKNIKNKANSKLIDIENDTDFLDCEMKQKLEKRTFTITNKMIEDVKKLLTLLGVAWIVTDKGYEAEHLGAELTNDGLIDTFLTSDSDTLMFGGKSMIRRIKKKGSKKYIYEEYILNNILIDYKLTREQLVHLGLVMGCDFAAKAKGIGIRTVLKKGLDYKLTEEQINAKKYFMSKCPYKLDQIKKTPIDKENLVKWLVECKNFNKNRIENLINIL
jgi:flap endonuclease-1